MKWWQLHPIIAPYPPEWIHEEKSRKDAKEWMNMATDHIEQLEREKASWKGAYDGAVLALTERNKELEAALKFYECGCKQDSCTPEEPKFRSIKCGWIAKAALGEKKDE
jgi:hypothetical protein